MAALGEAGGTLEIGHSPALVLGASVWGASRSFPAFGVRAAAAWPPVPIQGQIGAGVIAGPAPRYFSEE